jgi:hypothetical protein
MFHKVVAHGIWSGALISTLLIIGSSAVGATIGPSAAFRARHSPRSLSRFSWNDFWASS